MKLSVLEQRLELKPLFRYDNTSISTAVTSYTAIPGFFVDHPKGVFSVEVLLCSYVGYSNCVFVCHASLSLSRLCLVSLCVLNGLRLVIVALPELFSYLFWPFLGIFTYFVIMLTSYFYVSSVESLSIYIASLAGVRPSIAVLYVR